MLTNFKYVYIDELTGKRKKDFVKAESLSHAKAILSEKIIIDIKEANGVKSKNPLKYHKYYPNILHRMAFLVSAGVNIIEVIELIAKENKKIKELYKGLNAIKDSILNGQTLSSAFSEQAHIFDKLVISTVKIGEETGKLDVMLFKLSGFYKRKLELERVIKKSLLQPALTLFVAAVGFIFVMAVIIPKLISIFTDIGMDIPKSTQRILDFSAFLKSYGFLFVALGIALTLWLSFLMKNKNTKLLIDKMICRIPYIGKYLKIINLAVISSNLGILIQSGVDLQSSLWLIRDIIKNTHIRKSVVTASQLIESGIQLSMAFSESKDVYDDSFLSVLRVGESTGNIDEVLILLSDEYYENVNMMAVKMTTIMNFVVLLVITFIVGVMVMSIYGPIQGLSKGLMEMNV